MQQTLERLHEIFPANPHIFSDMGGIAVEKLQEETQEETIKQLTGKHGTINVILPNREIKETDEDINSLLARVLLMREKRLASEE